MSGKSRNDELDSPCVGNCMLDEYGFCAGCHRSMAEILTWPEMDEKQRREALDRIAQRISRGGGRVGFILEDGAES